MTEKEYLLILPISLLIIYIIIKLIMIKDNLHYFKISQKNPEKFLDSNYMFVEEDVNLQSYAERTGEIKNLLITIKNIWKKKRADDVLGQVFNDLQKLLKQFSNYSEFGCFINACDSSIKENIKDVDLLKRITYLYIEKRKLNNIVPAEWIQAVIDKGSSRKKCSAGENKLIDILEKAGFTKVNKLQDFVNCDKCVAKLSKTGQFSNKNIKEYFGVSIGGNTQDKSLDLVIRIDKNLFFVEAKHLNTGGGEQNKQILELIEVLNKKSGKKNCHFVSFLDGIHSNNVLNNGSRINDKIEKSKIQIQYNDIIRGLKNNKQNFWVNTAGFKELMRY